MSAGRRPPGKAFDAAEHAIRSRVERHEETPLFAERPSEESRARIPLNLRTPLPVAPGSETSRAAADNVNRRKEIERVLIWFAAQTEPRTTHECAAVLYPNTGTGSACPRINELVFLKCLERVGKQGRRATLRITAKGRDEANTIIQRGIAA